MLDHQHIVNPGTQIREEIFNRLGLNEVRGMRDKMCICGAYPNPPSVKESEDLNASKDPLQRLREIKTLLMGIDARSIRAIRAAMAGEATAIDRAEILSLEEHAKVLREEAAAINLRLKLQSLAPQ